MSYAFLACLVGGKQFSSSGDLRSFLKIFPPGVIANTRVMMMHEDYYEDADGE